MFLLKRTFRFIYSLQFLQLIFSILFFIIVYNPHAKDFPLRIIGPIITVFCLVTSAILIYLGIIGIQRNNKLPLGTKGRTMGLTTSWMSIFGLFIGWIPIIAQLYTLSTGILAIITTNSYTDY